MTGPLLADDGEHEWDRLAELLGHLLDQEPDARAMELQALRGTEPHLAEQLAEYLRYGSVIEDFLDRPLVRRDIDAAVRLLNGARIGPYSIIECLGFGGMGEVYLARRVDDFDHRVAIKVLRKGRATGAWLQRFARERQLLAHLGHPNIAGLLDGGSTDEGLPYLVMEYVDGLAVDDFVHQRDLDTPQCLELFLDICRAVAYLHRNLVVHRDLKPGNVLVTADGEPRLVDFGIAKSLDERELDPRITSEAGPPLTLLYSSPEQVRGERINTATDVYSIGVLLNVMLTGEAPYGPPRGEVWGRDELRRAICELPPWPPSRTAAGGPQARRWSGDLDSIVLRALAKEPEERYESVDALADDVRRYLVGKPVQAHRGGLLYRLSKFLRTYRVAIAVGALILTSAVISTSFGWQAARERDAAVQARTHAEGYASFLEDLFKEAAPDRSGNPGLSAIELLDRGRRELLEPPTAASPPLRQLADLASSVGAIYRQAGEYDESAELLDRSIQHWRQIIASDDASDEDGLKLAQVLNQRCGVAYRQGRWREAELLISESLALRRRLEVAPEDLAPAIYNLATIRLQRGLYDDAEAAYLEVLEIRRRAFGEPSAEVAATYYALGALEFNRKDLMKAEMLLRRSLASRLAFSEKSGTRTASIRSTLGRVLLEKGSLREAEKELREALAIRIASLPTGHQDIALSKRDVAAFLVEVGQPATALVLAEEAVQSLRLNSPDAEFWIASAESVAGACQLGLDRLDEAEVLLTRSHEAIERLRPDSVYARQSARRLAALEARRLEVPEP